MRTVSGFIFVGLVVFLGSFIFGNLLSVTLLRAALPPSTTPGTIAIMASAFPPALPAGEGAARSVKSQPVSNAVAAGSTAGALHQSNPTTTRASVSTLPRRTGPNVALASSPSSSIVDEVHDTLASWVGSIRTKDLPAHMGHYGPLLETYYTKQDVPWASIYRDRNRFLTVYRLVVEYRIGNVIVRPRSPDEAVVEFDKWWEFRTRDDRRFAGKELQRLVLRRIDGRLRIVSEEDLAVHWIIRQ